MLLATRTCALGCSPVFFWGAGGLPPVMELAAGVPSPAETVRVKKKPGARERSGLFPLEEGLLD